jgi:tRNA (guanine-N(7)-)-methyltransferase subunit TRM82
VRSLDLGTPVLNFITSGNLIWVLLDGEWRGSPESNPDMVRVIQWTPDSQQVGLIFLSQNECENDIGPQLIEVRDENPLLTSLNTQHLIPGSYFPFILVYQLTIIVAASADQLDALDLYGQLTSLPKHVDATRDPMRQDIEEKAELAAEGVIEMTPRELGRLRHKKALAAKTNKKAGNVAEEEDQAPDSKKVKSDDGYNGEDTTMDS